jgi:hypothetical protein
MSAVAAATFGTLACKIGFAVFLNILTPVL